MVIENVRMRWSVCVCVCVCLEMLTENVRMRWRVHAHARVCVCVCVDRDSQGVQSGQDGDRPTLRGREATLLHPGTEESFWGQDWPASLPPSPSLLGTHSS